MDESRAGHEQAADDLVRASHGNDADAVWDGLARFFDAVDKAAREGRERRHTAALARRRARYQARKAAGTLPDRNAARKAREAAWAAEEELEFPEECYCAVTSMPPCSVCCP